MFDKELYNYPIEKVLEALGARKGPGKDMWFSPFREETRASLHIDKEKNLWNDFGLGQGGSIVQLVMLARRCNCRDAEAFIASLSPCMYEKPEPSAPKSEIKAVSEIRSDYLINYLQKRKIPLELARQYCKEVIVRNPQKGMNFTLLGFPNNMGGYALNAPTGFKSTTKAAVTTINTEGKMSVTPSSKSVAVFEGFFDFLSWQMMQGSKTPSCDIVVLNSVNNLQKATAFIGAHEKITGFLDNDEAGQKCQTALERLFPGKVTDMSDLYGKYKDLNEMLQNSRGYTAEMKLTPHA
ncbi:MAG: toprim domain-containing protein [Candidatus Cryptobacteroides sp.]